MPSFLTSTVPLWGQADRKGLLVGGGGSCLASVGITSLNGEPTSPPKSLTQPCLSLWRPTAAP